MAASKCQGFHKKRNTEVMMLISRLRKSLGMLSRLHSDHYKLMERFLSFETAKKTYQQPMDKDKQDLPSELNKKKRGENLAEADSKSDEDSPDTSIEELQNQLRDALERNKQWLEYDQERDAFVRATMGRMLWLEKQLNEASPACSKKHNKDHSDENEQIRQIQEYYERLLEKARNELEVLREQVNIPQNNLTTARHWCRDTEEELGEVKLQLRTEKMSLERSPEDRHHPEDDVKQLTDKNKDLQEKLYEERRRSANSELQVDVLQKIVLNNHSANLEKIADLERQIRICTQDLEDEQQNCLHLKNQMIRLLKLQKKTDRHEAKSTKFKNPPPSQSASVCGPSSQNESLLACPSCLVMYPVSEYQDLMEHIDTCFD